MIRDQRQDVGFKTYGPSSLVTVKLQIGVVARLGACVDPAEHCGLYLWFKHCLI